MCICELDVKCLHKCTSVYIGQMCEYMYVYIYIFHVYMYIYMYVCVCTYTYIHIYWRRWVPLHHAVANVHVMTTNKVVVYIYVYVYIEVCIHIPKIAATDKVRKLICICICIYLNTHIYTHK